MGSLIALEAAALAKVDYIKFQTFSAEDLVTKNATKSKYQITFKEYELLKYEIRVQYTNWIL